jgi:hypothetical protein
MAHVAFAVAAGLQAVSSIKQGQNQAAALKIQAKSAELKGRANALQYMRQSLEALENHRRYQGTITSVAAANNINPFTGSPLSLDQRNAFEMGKEYNFSAENADMAIASGLAESQSLQAAAKQVKQMSYINAAAAIASGVYGYNQLAPGAGAASTSGGFSFSNMFSSGAPVVEKSVVAASTGGGSMIYGSNPLAFMP